MTKYIANMLNIFLCYLSHIKAILNKKKIGSLPKAYFIVVLTWFLGHFTIDIFIY